MQRIEILGHLENYQEEDAEQNIQDEIFECLHQIRSLARELQDFLDKKDSKLTLKALNKLMLQQSKRKMYDEALETIVEIEEIHKKNGEHKNKEMAKI